MKVRIFSIFIAAILFLLICEIGIRLTGLYSTVSEKVGNGFISLFSVQHKGWFYTHRSNQTLKISNPEFSFNHKMDAFGFRNNESIDTSRYSILAFGDSFTEGLGTSQDSTWPALLQNETGKQVYNAGIMGATRFMPFGFSLTTKLVSNQIKY